MRLPLSTLKFILSFFVLTLLQFAVVSKVFAAIDKQFQIDYGVQYVLAETGETQVTQNVTITNLKNDVIVSSYTFTVNQMQPYEVQATSNGNKIEPEKVTKDGQTSLTIKVANYVIGMEKQNKLTLTFKTKDLSNKIGEIWNVNIPKTQITDATNTYNVTLVVPEKLGPKIFVSPLPTGEKNVNGTNEYYFTKENLMDKGITASFGKYQVINYRIKYQIENQSFLPEMREIAFPTDVQGMQQVKYISIDPQPLKIKTDDDGNAIGVYKLAPNQKLEVKLIGSVRISGKQINPEFGGKFEYLPKDLLKKFTPARKYWEVNSVSIQATAKKLKDPNQTVAQNAQKIYKFITENLTYNYDATKESYVKRNGAETALTEKGPWTCMEFTDLFIALARAEGIPAREIDGYAVASDEKTKPVSISLRNGDYLHAWAEFYDPVYGWVQIDPTWGTTSGMDYFTKLDTNHFTFVKKGLNSEYPKPAGSYRFEDTGKLVEVDFSQTPESDDFEDKIILKQTFDLNPMQMIKGNLAYVLKNGGGTFLYGITPSPLAPGEQTTVFLPNGSSVVKYKDFNGHEVSQDAIIIR